MLNAGILATSLLAGLILLLPRIAAHRTWRAATTPLASIIGSGFLILGPVLDASYGVWAPLVMVLLCLVAYCFGAAIRVNIRTIATHDGQRDPLEQRIDTIASFALAFAYMISVAYYLNLFGAFGVSLTNVNDAFHARLLTSAIYALILAVGIGHGFTALERAEQVSVGLKLAVIAGLLFGLVVHVAGKAADDALVFNPAAVSGWSAVTLALGLIVTVQGFETSRYLGTTYGADTLIQSMKLAQWLSTAIYLVYVVCIAYVFPRGQLVLTETAIIDLMVIVAPVLPVLLVAAALAAQFSAAIADTAGGGGLVAELTAGRISTHAAYAIITALGLAMTWALNVFEIMAYASRAFALYYALQCVIASVSIYRTSPRDPRLFFYVSLAVLGAAMALFGTSVES